MFEPSWPGKSAKRVFALEHDPEKWEPVFPRDKREAFARRSCSNKKIERDDDSKKSHPALGNPAIHLASQITSFWEADGYADQVRA
jgi:hypothetical protein